MSGCRFFSCWGSTKIANEDVVYGKDAQHQTFNVNVLPANSAQVKTSPSSKLARTLKITIPASPSPSIKIRELEPKQAVTDGKSSQGVKEKLCTLYGVVPGEKMPDSPSDKDLAYVFRRAFYGISVGHNRIFGNFEKGINRKELYESLEEIRVKQKHTHPDYAYFALKVAMDEKDNDIIFASIEDVISIHDSEGETTILFHYDFEQLEDPAHSPPAVISRPMY